MAKQSDTDRGAVGTPPGEPWSPAAMGRPRLCADRRRDGPALPEVAMARVMPTTDRAVDVRMVMERLGVDEVQAGFIVALARGEVAGDIEFARPVTSEERRRM